MDLIAEDNYIINDYVEVQTIYEPHFESSITTSVFDPQQELLWTGNHEGRVSSYYGFSLSKYTSFRIQEETSSSEVKMIYPSPMTNDVFLLKADSLSSYSRFGTLNFKHKEVSFQNLQCMFMNQQERFFLGGFSNFIYDFDVERLRVLRQLAISDDQSDCILIKCSSPSTAGGVVAAPSRSGILCTGSSNGQVILRDPFSLKCMQKLQPHSGSLSDIDVHGNYLVSCGFSMTRSANLCVDRFLMVYDLRMMRALNPVQLLIEPCFLHYLPMCSSVVAVASQSACFQLIDTNLIQPSNFYQAQVPPIEMGLATTFSMSTNSQSFAFGHSSGSIHLFSKGDNINFNDFSEPTLMIDPPQYNNNYIDINHEVAPLSSVSVPINNQQLLSDWPLETLAPKYRPTPVVSAHSLENPRIIHGIASVPNKMGMARNQIYNDEYRSYMETLAKRIEQTSISLKSMDNQREIAAVSGAAAAAATTTSVSEADEECTTAANDQQNTANSNPSAETTFGDIATTTSVAAAAPLALTDSVQNSNTSHS